MDFDDILNWLTEKTLLPKEDIWVLKLFWLETFLENLDSKHWEKVFEVVADEQVSIMFDNDDILFEENIL